MRDGGDDRAAVKLGILTGDGPLQFLVRPCTADHLCTRSINNDVIACVQTESRDQNLMTTEGAAITHGPGRRSRGRHGEYATEFPGLMTVFAEQFVDREAWAPVSTLDLTLLPCILSNIMMRMRASDLTAWAKISPRKPLVLRGARQVGKSWLVNAWGQEHFGRVVEVNLERRPEAASCFAVNDPIQVIQRLEIVLGARIPTDGSTLLFLDEIQAVPEVLAKLRWFAEELPQVPVIAAGSLLDFTLADHRFSMPVGRITYLHLEPMGFIEFCQACGETALASWLETGLDLASINAGVPEAIHHKAMALFRTWVLVGGMPAAVAAYIRERSFLPVGEVHRDLLATIRDDFAKYAGRVHHRRLTATLDSVPRQLGQKFTFTKVDREERAAALRQALDLLSSARVCHRVLATDGRGLPLGAGADDKTTKVILLDTGLVSSALKIDLAALEQLEELTLANEGAIAEQAVGQLLRLNGHANEDPALWYWSRAAKSSSAEIDYLCAPTSHVLPVEVKAGGGGAMRSLHLFMAERDLRWAVRFNSAAPMIQKVDTVTSTGTEVRYRLLSLPAYAAEILPRLAKEVDATLERQ